MMSLLIVQLTQDAEDFQKWVLLDKIFNLKVHLAVGLTNVLIALEMRKKTITDKMSQQLGIPSQQQATSCWSSVVSMDFAWTFLALL